MANPLDLNLFKHYLEFNSDNTGRIQISEPVAFDASAFNLEQKSDGYARNITLMAEEADLEFYEGFFEMADSPYELPNGLIVDRLGHALEFLLEYNRKFGFQSNVKYVLEKNGVEFILGQLNFEGAETDERTYFKCKIVQALERAIVTRREDIEIDAFSDKNVDGDPITPLTTTNILLKAKPFFRKSTWTIREFTFSQTNQGRQFFAGFPIFDSLKTFEIEDSLISFEQSYTAQIADEPSFLEQYRSDISQIKAKADLRDVKVKISNLSFTSSGTSTAPVIKKLTVNYGSSYVTGNFTTVELESTTNDVFNIIDQSYEVDIPFIPNGGFIYIHYYMQDNVSTVGNIGSYGFNVTSGDLEITAIAKATNSVVKGVKYIDLIKQGIKSINGMDVDADDFEQGGEHENLYALSGNLIRQRDDVPFTFTLKDRVENLMLFNSDLQINPDQCIVKRYDKFYDNVENGSFITPASSQFKMTYNSKYTINKLSWKYDDYEQDKDEENTLDSVHTEYSLSIINTQVQNEKQISISDIYDPFRIEFQRSEAIKDTTSLETDDKISVLDCVDIPSNYFDNLTSRMSHQWDSVNGILKILNEGDFNWTLLGFEIGDQIFLTPESELNVGTYTVTAFESTLITLSVDGTNLDPGDGEELFTAITYPVTNTTLTNRTDEGFDQIQNLESGTNFSNLRYTIRRNLVNWESYISTCAEFIDTDPNVTFFKNNGDLITQYEGGIVYKENDDIDLDAITPAILTSRTYDVDVVADYDQVLALVQAYETKEGIGGFIRVMDSNGAIKLLYPTAISYVWATEVLTITGEERKLNEVVTVERSGNTILINEVGYDTDTLSEIFYEANGEYVVLFDKNNVNLTNPTRFDKFVVNGLTFSNTTDLIQALIDL